MILGVVSCTNERVERDDRVRLFIKKQLALSPTTTERLAFLLR